ncbi:MAG: hypothetical protein OXH15_05305 [Gammaproteobacteria bacterium]|nr:hypothetical protein [Gammaproteobacteria bacterium]
MGLFRRAKPAKETTKERPPPVAAGGLLDAAETEAAAELWRLTALPREEFDATYGEMLRGFWRCIGGVRGAAWTALRGRALAHAIAALKVRRAHVLPRFAAAEDAARLAEVMSFALAACVVAERFGQVLGRAAGPDWCPMEADVPAQTELADVAVPRAFGALVLPRLLGPAGHEWLGQQPEALREVAAYFGGGPSQLRAIADDAAARIGMPPPPPPPASAMPAPGAGQGGHGAVEAAPADAGDAAPQTGTDAARTTRTAPAPAGAADGTARGGDAARPARASSDIGDGRVGWQWFNWVRARLRDGSVVPNAAGAWLHNIDGSAYVVDPDGFEALAEAESVAPKSIRNRVRKLGRHRTRRSGSGRADAFPAELADGRRVTGMLFDGELFWDRDAPPASRSTLR